MSLKAASPDQGGLTTTEGGLRGEFSNTAQAQSLWDALTRARANYAPRVMAAAEDAVFRWYLPLAREVAAGRSVSAPGPDAIEEAAALGLAQAVLSWRQPDCREFERFARTVITERLQRCTAELGTRRAASLPEQFSPLPGLDRDVVPTGTLPGSGS